MLYCELGNPIGLRLLAGVRQTKLKKDIPILPILKTNLGRAGESGKLSYRGDIKKTAALHILNFFLKDNGVLEESESGKP